jgi:HEAT repeat protein
MTPALEAIALALGTAGLLLSGALLVARGRMVRTQERETQLEIRLGPLALDIVEGEVLPLERVRAMSHAEQLVLARIVGRYARWLDGDARVRIAAFFERSGLLELELRTLRSRHAWRRVTSARTLGGIGSPIAVPALLHALDDPDRDVRAAAVTSLGRLEAPDAAEPIVRALVRADVPRVVAGEALIQIGERAAPALVPLTRAEDDQVRATSVQLLGHVGSPAHAPLIAGLAQDLSAEVRAKACRALAHVGGPRELAAVREALGDRIPFVRVNAAHALATLGDSGDVPRLLQLAETDEFDVARAAAEAVAAIDPEAVVAARASSPSAHVGEAADAVRVLLP